VAVPASELERRPDAIAVIDDDIHVSTDDDSGTIKALEAAVSELRERAERDKAEIARERDRADASDGRVRELTAKLDAAQENEARLREERAAAIAKAEAAEAQLDDAKAEARKEGEGRAKAEARAELLQDENEKLRAEAVRAGQEDRAEEPWRRRWRFWGRRR
jgi:chromosome segregation ATPase